jgi:hypothetical protein
MALSWKYSASCLERACSQANLFNNKNVQYLERVIKTKKGEIRNTENEVNQRAYNPYLRGIKNIH